MIKIDTPYFASEAEEARWWFEHQDVIDQAFFDEHPLLRGKTVIDVMVDQDDVHFAEAQAAAKGITRDAYLAELVHQALQERKAA